jgi:hypothetical protein
MDLLISSFIARSKAGDLDLRTRRDHSAPFSAWQCPAETADTSGTCLQGFAWPDNAAAAPTAGDNEVAALN